MTIATHIQTLFRCRLIGKDQQGNKYYESKAVDTAVGRKIRSVIYKGKNEASRVPPAWHAWLHYTTDAPLETQSHSWQKPAHQNLTGTSGAYFPPGHMLGGSKRQKATGDYTAWNPRHNKGAS